MAKARGWRGSGWRRESLEVRRGWFGRCVMCGWRRSQEAHHLSDRCGRVPLCSWCHHRVTAYDVRHRYRWTWLDTLLVIGLAWVRNAVVVAAVVLLGYSYWKGWR